MKKTVFILACVFILMPAAGLQAQKDKTRNVKSSGSQVTETYNVGSFTGVNSSSGVRVEIVNGKTGVEVKTDKNAFDYIKVSVRNGVLHVGYTNNVNVRNITTTFYVSTPALDLLDASSGSSIKVADRFSGSKLTAESSSGASVSAQGMEYSEIKVSTSSGASVKMAGQAGSVNVSASSGGSAGLDGLKAENVKASASSGGSVKCYASESATGSASSGGSVGIAGNPKNMDVRKSSGGSVNIRK